MTSIYWPHSRLYPDLDPKHCHARVRSDDDWIAHQCNRKAVIDEDGARWCKQHAPSAQKARDMARRKKRDDEWAAHDRKHERARLRNAVCDAAMAVYFMPNNTNIRTQTTACAAYDEHEQQEPTDD